MSGGEGKNVGFGFAKKKKSVVVGVNVRGEDDDDEDDTPPGKGSSSALQSRRWSRGLSLRVDDKRIPAYDEDFLDRMLDRAGTPL